MSGPTAAWLDDGKRLHLQHGPIDLIIEADGAPEQTKRAYARAASRFQTVLTELVRELPRLRTDCPANGLGLTGSVARRMEAAVLPMAQHRITPMAAVAGAVADEIMAAMQSDETLDRAYVNNGGDIALMLGENASFDIAVAGWPDRPAIIGRVRLSSGDGIGGIATSGRHGRSHSLGIADSVTVLAANAAAADAAATLIANEVNLPDHSGVTRVPARDLSPDSDLGERLVTVDVTGLSRQEAARALEAGASFARDLVRRETIRAAALYLDDQCSIVGDFPGWRPLKHQSCVTAGHVQRQPGNPAGPGPAMVRPSGPAW